MDYEATVLITTKNRKDDLRRAVNSAVMQEARVEVLVIDDGSTDGTSEMLASEFPSVRVIRSEESKGYIVQRNIGTRLASAPIVFSIDDDAEFSSPHIVAQTLAEFNHPRIGAIFIPVYDVFRKIEYRLKNAATGTTYAVDTFGGTHYALRVDLFLMLGGYRELFHHQGEEGDYCARLLNAGYVVRYGNADDIRHYVSLSRSWSKIAYFGARNDVLFAWANVPFPYLLIHLPGTSVKHMINSLKSGQILPVLKGLFTGYYDALRGEISRQPISKKSYRLLRRLKKKGPCNLPEIESNLNVPSRQDQKYGI